MHSIASVFSTPIFINTIDVLSQEDIAYINSLEYYGPNAGGNLTSSNVNILNDMVFLKLKAEIEQNLKLYVENVMAPKDLVSLRITQSWANKNSTGTGHHKHNHSNSIVSGVYYLSLNPSPIHFEQFLNSTFRVIPTKSTPFNTEVYTVNCSKNMLVLFPSHLQHYVNNNESEYDRLSIAFNTFYSGTFGEDKMLTLLELK